MNCNADEEERRNREISRNIDRQIKIEKNKRENVRILTICTIVPTLPIDIIVVLGTTLQSAPAGDGGGGENHFCQADEDF